MDNGLQRTIKMYFLEKKVFGFWFYWSLFSESSYNYVIIGPGNGLALNRRQAIMLTSDNLFIDEHMP